MKSVFYEILLLLIYLKSIYYNSFPPCFYVLFILYVKNIHHNIA